MNAKSTWRDKARKTLYHLSQQLGETLSSQPQSLRDCAQASESLKLDLPSLTTILPYETIDEEGFFINRHSQGFGLCLAPMAGANETLVASLAELFKTQLTEGTDCTVLLYKHPYLANQLQQSFAPILARGGIYAELARGSLAYHLKAIQQGYTNGRQIPAQLCDYRCYLFISRKRKPDASLLLKRLREAFESELKVAGFHFSRLDEQELASLVRTLVSPNPNEIVWPQVNTSQSLLNEAIPAANSVYEIHDSAIDISLTDENGDLYRTRVINCELKAYPSTPFGLWQTPDLFANLLKPDQGIQCPFLISFTIRGVNQERLKTKAKQRAKSLSANNNAIQNFINPGLKEEASEWRLVHEQLSKGELALFPTFYNLVLFTEPEQAREQVAKAMASYRHLGFTLIPSRCTQWLRFLASLPFLATDGLFAGLEILGLTTSLSHENVANLLPIVADFKGSSQGLLVPTYRHQLFYLDSFDDQVLPITNFNRLTVASPGAGKTLFEQAQILDGLSRGELIFVIDLGASYKHLCQLVGGTYIDAATLSLNPFTLFDFDGVTDIAGESVNDHIQIRDLLAIMASPNTPLAEVQKAWLLEVVLTCWKAYGRKTTMDKVLDELRHLLSKPESKNDRRLKDLLILLSKYGSQGIYGTLFNSETRLFHETNFVVLEMGSLESNPELLTIVMFVMIVVIQGQFYHSDRRLKKRCIIDEAWRFLAAGSNPTAAQFIEQGFRTARKHSGGFAVITQHLSDTLKTIQGQAIAASADTKIIMRQGAFKEFVEQHPHHFNALEQTMIASFGEAKNQGFSSLMIQCGQLTTYHRYFCDPFLRVLFSTSGDEFGEIEALTKQGMPLATAISQIAARYQGQDNA